jgi:hypothetical protein
MKERGLLLNSVVPNSVVPNSVVPNLVVPNSVPNSIEWYPIEYPLHHWTARQIRQRRRAGSH